MELFKKEEINKKIKVKDKKIIVLDESIKKEIDKVRLSPTMIDKMLSSPGDWVMSKFIENEVSLDNQDALIRGNWFHSILEDFFKKPIANRDDSELKLSFKEVTEAKYKDLLKRDDHKKWIELAIKNYRKFFLKEDKEREIPRLRIMGEDRDGIELFVTGKLGNCNRQIVGFIDKIVTGKGGLIIQDYKTGSSVYECSLEEVRANKGDFSYFRQQTIYALLLKKQGFEIEESSLVMPMLKEPKVVKVPFDSEDVVKRTLEEVEQADRKLTECIEDNYTFPLGFGKYNSWYGYFTGKGNNFMKIDKDKLEQLVEVVNE